MIEVQYCPLCGSPAYLDEEGRWYECSNGECLYAWEDGKPRGKK